MFLLWREDLLIELVEGSYYLKKKERKKLYGTYRWIVCIIFLDEDNVVFQIEEKRKKRMND